jgi:hypothetical protein
MAHAQKPDFALRRNGWVNLNRPGGGGGQFSLLAGEPYRSACRVCTARASLCFVVTWSLLVTQSILLFPLHFSSRASPCAITFQTQSTNQICDWRYTFLYSPCGHYTVLRIYGNDLTKHLITHHNKILIKMTTKMQLCRIIYYSVVSWLLYTFRAILPLNIRSILTVITASGFIHMCCCRLLLSHVSSRQHHMWIKTEAVITVKMLLMMRDNIARNM